MSTIGITLLTFELAAWTADTAATRTGGESVVELVHRVGGWLDEQLTGGARWVVAGRPGRCCAATVPLDAAVTGNAVRISLVGRAPPQPSA